MGIIYLPSNSTASHRLHFDGQALDMYDLALNMSWNDSNDYQFCHPFHSYLQFFTIFYTPIIVAIGLIGNLLSFFVLLTTHLKLRSSSYYLAALAISDFGFLVTVLITYCTYNEIFELFDRKEFCKLYVYLSSVCAFLSVWLTVAFTTERFIAVRYPLRRQYICTVSRAKMIVVGIICFGLLSQVHLLWMVTAIKDEDRNICEMDPAVNWYIANVINFLDTVFTFVIPMTLILIMNTLIAKVIFKSRRLAFTDDDRFRFQYASSQALNELQSSDSTRNSDQESTASKRYIRYEEYSIRCNRQHRASNNQAQHNINKMLLIISSVFIALNFPSYVIRIVAYFGFTMIDRIPPEYLHCAQLVSQMLYYTNFSINFILYALCGRSFRLCLKKMFRDLFRRIV
ncbi:thyrotropin-releasing hormone receptor [Sitophilus oryzae]|uniref:Thyrotropin-releasing hormone receptor n=1 Tax=Sitophilus oryzae TaxID=7048 RepID=A0A6J2YWB7_SITOR|nr:thyrotropin-releasing hormone receptor [Sitophilus oryzae]